MVIRGRQRNASIIVDVVAYVRVVGRSRIVIDAVLARGGVIPGSVGAYVILQNLVVTAVYRDSSKISILDYKALHHIVGTVNVHHFAISVATWRILSVKN